MFLINTIDAIERDCLHTLLDTDPANWEIRAVLADWYEEHGDEASAKFHRFLIGRWSPEPPKKGDPLKDGWFWYVDGLIKEKKPSYIGNKLWWKVNREKPGNIRYRTRQEAENRLRTVLEELNYELHRLDDETQHTP